MLHRSIQEAQVANPKYSKKPMKDLWKKGGFSDKKSFEQHRRQPDRRPEHANWKDKNRKWTFRP